MKQDASFFIGKEPVLVYIAKRLKEALRVEALFTERGINYGVEADRYRGGIIFQSDRIGAFFYVLRDAAEAAHFVLRANGYAPVSEAEAAEIAKQDQVE